MNKLLSAPIYSLIMATSFVALLSSESFAGNEEELAARKIQIERQVFANIKASVVGGQQTPENKLVIDTLRARKEMRSIARLPEDTIVHGLTYLNGPSFAQASCASHTFGYYARDPELKNNIRAHNEKEALDRVLSLLGPFVTIPEGNLPSTVEGNFVQDGPFVPPFEFNSYPVTRDLWMEVMKKIPDEVPDRERATWADCKKCPVNYVAYENTDLSPAEIQDFLKRLNEKTLSTKCIYDLPDDNQLWYSIRGDISGQNPDPYSKGVTNANVDQYITHSGNSGGQIQLVGRKLLNDFGIELGNVWKISKSSYSQLQPRAGRSKRGGSWKDFAMRSEARYYAVTGSLARSSETGFSVIRTCY